MSDNLYRTPTEILEITIKKGMMKVKAPLWKQFTLGFMAGAFVGFAAAGSNMASFGLLTDATTYGLGKLVTGLVFPVGLMLILVAGGELFTGNCLIAAAVLEKKVSLRSMLKNWILVYCGNFIGALTVAFLIIQAGQLDAGASLLGGMTIKTAHGKMMFTTIQAVSLGILCNWLVCAAVWICYAAKNLTDILFAVFFPIMLFAISGFEHCVANMYYVPAALMATSFEKYISASGLGTEALMQLNWINFLIKNLIPVTIGNIIGGVFFVATIYTFCYKEQ